MTLFEAMQELVAKYSPQWVLVMPSAHCREHNVVEFRGALPSTLHFGSARLTLDTGVMVFFDEDHRDGYDFEEQRVTLTADELARVRDASRPPP